jgi:hypothetical protein
MASSTTEGHTTVKKSDQKSTHTTIQNLELLPVSMNDDHYDGVIHISRHPVAKKPRRSNKSGRRPFQRFTF